MTERTKGPWGWFGNERMLYLATLNRGRQIVMGFKRLGTNGAQPTFNVGGRMVPASDLVKFEVGDQSVTGFGEGRSDDSVYRYDINAIEHPDARLIAAAPEMFEALEAVIDAMGEIELSDMHHMEIYMSPGSKPAPPSKKCKEARHLPYEAETTPDEID